MIVRIGRRIARNGESARTPPGRCHGDTAYLPWSLSVSEGDEDEGLYCLNPVKEMIVEIDKARLVPVDASASRMTAISISKVFSLARFPKQRAAP